MLKAFKRCCVPVLCVLVASTAALPTGDEWQERATKLAAMDDPICTLAQALSPSGVFANLSTTTCGVLANPTGSCCAMDPALAPCDSAKGVTIIAGVGRDPVLTVDSCQVEDTHQVFQPIWSATKMITASMVMALVEKKTLNLDTPISEYISWWTSDPTDPRSSVTLRHTLSMTSGFTQHPCVADMTVQSDGTRSGGVGSTPFTNEECARLIYETSYGHTALGKPLIKRDGSVDSGADMTDTCSFGRRVEGVVTGDTVVTPGKFFCYHEAQWEITAIVAMTVTNKSSLQQLFADTLVPMIGIDTDSCYLAWPSVTNSDGGGGLYCSAREFAKYLGAYVSYDLHSKATTTKMETVQARFAEPLNIGSVFNGYALGLWYSDANPNGFGDGGNNGFACSFTRGSSPEWMVMGRSADEGMLHGGHLSSQLFGSVVDLVHPAMARANAGGSSDASHCGVCP